MKILEPKQWTDEAGISFGINKASVHLWRERPLRFRRTGAQGRLTHRGYWRSHYCCSWQNLMMTPTLRFHQREVSETEKRAERLRERFYCQQKPKDITCNDSAWHHVKHGPEVTSEVVQQRKMLARSRENHTVQLHFNTLRIQSITATFTCSHWPLYQKRLPYRCSL